MAKYDSFWGIDIGQCAIKAMRCRLSKDGNEIIADAFDFIEYPQILSQPDADPAQLIADALDEFLKRNPVKGSHVAISVPGQRGLPRFVKLPPVESSKIPDLVKFEARQQIPFPLEDVVWDFQQMPGGTEEDGFSMETEVGLFAMKREEVFRSLKPFTNAGVEVDIVQLTPIALFNYAVFDQMRDLPAPSEYNPDDPPESLVVLSLGTDTSDLVVTNGYRVWQRSIPLGGNHFTKSITKELKVTFSKAEHLKRNAMKTEDPRAIFQAMKPVFDELVTEIQRSLNFYNSLAQHKNAKLGRIVALGNTMKLRGLQKFLAQKLEMEVVTVDGFDHLTGSSVVSAPQFEENVGSFGVCYGLCVQALNKGVLATNLLPGEIIQERLIRAKKPWAVAAAATLLLSCGMGYFLHSLRWQTTKTEKFNSAFAGAESVSSKSKELSESFKTEEAKYDKLHTIGVNLARMPERQMLWPDLVRAVHECLPQAGKRPEELINNKAGQELPIGDREQIHIAAIDAEYTPALEKWFVDKIQKDYTKHLDNDQKKPIPKAPTTDTEAPAEGDAAAPVSIGPKGEGFIVEVRGYHFHNNSQKFTSEGVTARYVYNNFIKKLEQKIPAFKVRNLATGKEEMITFADFGISYPVIANETSTATTEQIPNPYTAALTAGSGTTTSPLQPRPMTPPGAPGAATKAAPVTDFITAQKYSFIVQFAWQPKTEAQRAVEKAKAKAKAEADKAAQVANN
jgi:type IV pilus assembly protein PilM